MSESINSMRAVADPSSDRTSCVPFAVALVERAQHRPRYPGQPLPEVMAAID